jgi:8-oxo-dGTP diphosphatase
VNDKPRPGVGIGVMLKRDNTVLLGHRHPDPEKAKSLLNGADTWTMPGGKVRYGETFAQAAQRELKEETGIDVPLEDFVPICFGQDHSDQAHFVTIGMFCDHFRGEPKVMEPDQITEWRWWDLRNLPQKIYHPSYKVLTCYKGGTFYSG